MNFLINMIDNLNIDDKSYNVHSIEIQKEVGCYSKLVGAGGEFTIGELDVIEVLKRYGLKEQIGEINFNSLFQKPLMIFVFATQEDEFNGTKEFLDNRYGRKILDLNNFSQAFSLGCWFIKDSCVESTKVYLNNTYNGYNSQCIRDAHATMGDGMIKTVDFSDTEINEAFEKMNEIYMYLLPEKSDTGIPEKTYTQGTIIWNVENAISTEGNSFSRALIFLQEARRTGKIASKIEKYCAVLECLFAIPDKCNKKETISNIAANCIGSDKEEKNLIKNNIKTAYGIRSDSIHGDSLKYLKTHNNAELKELSAAVDDYVRRIFRKIMRNKKLNYNRDSKKMVYAYFQNMIESI